MYSRVVFPRQRLQRRPIFYSPNCRVKWVDWLMWRDCLLFRYTSNLSYTKIGFASGRLWLSACARVTWSVIKWLPRRLTRQVIKIFCNQYARALYPILSPIFPQRVHVGCATNERFVKAPGKTFCVTQIPARLPKQCTQRVKSKTDPFRGIYARCHSGMSCGGSHDFTHNQLDVQRYTPNTANENGQPK